MEKIPQESEYNRELFQKYRNKYYIILEHLMDLDDDERLGMFTKDIIDKKKDLKLKYGNNIQKHALYHAMTGSGIGGYLTIVMDDFPGEDSVARFLDEMERKYLG